MKNAAAQGIPVVVLTIAISVVGMVASRSAQAQTFTKIHDFAGIDGKLPVGTLTMDTAGSLYGTTSSGGVNENGTVFKITRHGSNWILTTLYKFTGGSDGWAPCGGVTIGPDGALYGTTSDSACFADGQYCENGQGCGTVFRLSPPPTRAASAMSPWIKTVLYHFAGGTDGSAPLSKVVFDAAGNIYGTTTNGGINNYSCNNIYGLVGCGTVYKLTHSNGSWTETLLHEFNINEEGAAPYSEVAFDTAGNIYGTTYFGPAVYELSPSGAGGALPSCGQGETTAGVVFDGSGNFYYAPQETSYVEIYELRLIGGGWQCLDLYAEYWGGPYATLTIDSASNLYGTDQWGTGQNGDVFEYQQGDGFKILYEFSGGWDGLQPKGGVVRGPDGALYGTTLSGGADGWGVIFQITP
jgi:uncharacterized repeat protein (TIGR03803 family)